MRWLLLQLSDLSMVWRCQILTQVQCQPQSCLYFPAWFSLRKHWDLVPTRNTLPGPSSRCKLVGWSVSSSKNGLEAGERGCNLTPSPSLYWNGMSTVLLGFELWVRWKTRHEGQGRAWIALRKATFSMLVLKSPIRNQWHEKRQLRNFEMSNQVRVLCYHKYRP